METDPRTKRAASEHPEVEEEIRKRAYELFEERGRETGREFED